MCDVSDISPEAIKISTPKICIDLRQASTNQSVRKSRNFSYEIYFLMLPKREASIFKTSFIFMVSEFEIELLQKTV
jgi:hypothetical protein